MSIISPQAMLLWATLSSTLLLFLVQHLYRYDRFQAAVSQMARKFRWGIQAIYDGGFISDFVPLIVTYSVAMAVMKYQAGYISFSNPDSTPSRPLPRIVVPAPTSTWPESHQKLVFPLYVIFAVAWALEIVSHLEELCFWLFMIKEQEDTGHGGIRPWFKSFEYKLWCCGMSNTPASLRLALIGSLIAVVLLPLVTLETRHDLQQVEAWTFFTGSAGIRELPWAWCYFFVIEFILTLLINRWKFPSFLKRIEAENAEPDVIVRLVAFQDLNRIRIVFRLMFVIPLLILACDGLRSDGPHHIIGTAGAVDILAMVGGIGCIVSSVITLLIFFPRSIAREQGYTARARTRSHPTMQTKSAKSGIVSRPHLTVQSRHTRSQRTTVGEIEVEPLQRPLAAHPLSPTGVQVTVQTTTRGDSSYFGGPTVQLGDEALGTSIQSMTMIISRLVDLVSSGPARSPHLPFRLLRGKGCIPYCAATLARLVSVLGFIRNRYKASSPFLSYFFLPSFVPNSLVFHTVCLAQEHVPILSF
ncbi:hypothetical protein AG1IA_01550 [Rhizoctonia solani AG-1 IA]|uniref:Uncharacterized protein n=1 Tax=Thanatephorus cucumeris (strain AG1-IA) TaxID=983506 RepID=L8X713_THACA|nr:hypothetical protein AG1IA_01550 [Rhizoctonia solani AG-1 IA]